MATAGNTGAAGGQIGRRALLRGAGAAGLGLAGAALLGPQAAEAAGPAKRFLFYRSGDGAALLGAIAGGAFVTRTSWGPGGFVAGFTHMVADPGLSREVLGYAQNPYRSVLIRYAYDDPVPAFWVAGQQLAPFATHVVPVLFGGWFMSMAEPDWMFYDRNTRSARFLYSDGRFSASWPGPWTHLVNIPFPADPAGTPRWRTFCYDTGTGSGALYSLMGDQFAFYSTNPPNAALPPVTAYPAGSFVVGWSHIACAADGGGRHSILFYRQTDGYYALARLNNAGTALSTFRTGYLGAWTHLTEAGPDGFFFYNVQMGAALITRVHLVYSTLVTVRSYPARSFATGWTHLTTVNA